MRALVLLVCLVGCAGPGPTREPEPEPTDSTIVSVPSSTKPIDVIGTLENDTALAASEVVFGLHDGYPTQIDLVPSKVVFIDQCRFSSESSVSWNVLRVVSGSGAAVVLQGSDLIRATLEDEGTVELELEGVIAGAQCNTARLVPLKQKLSLKVIRVAGFDVRSYGPIGFCGEMPVVPSEQTLSLPQVYAVSRSGEVFMPANASPAATLVMNGVRRYSETVFAPGRVTFSVNTTLPVTGLKGFDVVGPESVTAMDVSLGVQVRQSKGSQQVPLTEADQSVRFFFAEGNTVTLSATETTTSLGRLCAPPSQSWFVTTVTPGSVCEPRSIEFIGGVPLLAMDGPGLCSFETRVSGTALSWRGSFTATLQ